MTKIVAYLMLVLAVCFTAGATLMWGDVPQQLLKAKTSLLCGVAGGIGGCVYCLRAVYLNACVKKNWDETWQPWYYIRPAVSLLCGGVSYVFLKAGLLVLESNLNADATEFGFYALAFIAGLNVDKFIAKIEDIAQAAWGIEKSRASRVNDDKP